MGLLHGVKSELGPLPIERSNDTIQTTFNVTLSTAAVKAEADPRSEFSAISAPDGSQGLDSMIPAFTALESDNMKNGLAAGWGELARIHTRRYHLTKGPATNIRWRSAAEKMEAEGRESFSKG